jgi:uncharacterized damage-inducible protein DinB
MSDLLEQLFDHNSWAHQELITELRRVPPDPETLRLFAHIVAAEHLWLSRIDGVKPRVAVWPTLDLNQIIALEMENRARIRELLRRPDDSREQRVHYRNSAGNAFDNAVGDILTHVAMHGHYHRGQIARVMRAAGREPVYTDYIGFVRKGR